MPLTEKKEIRLAPTRGFIGLLSLGLFCWGLFVLNPWADTFASAPEVYGHLAAIAKEEVWGTLFLIAGCVMGYGTWKRNTDIISMGAMFGFMLWTMLSLSFAMESLSLSPIITNAVLALMHAWAWLSVKLVPSVITNKVVWNDEEVDALAELAQVRKTKQSV